MIQPYTRFRPCLVYSENVCLISITTIVYAVESCWSSNPLQTYKYVLFLFLLCISSIRLFFLSPPAAYIKLADFTSDEVTTTNETFHPNYHCTPIPLHSLRNITMIHPEELCKWIVDFVCKTEISIYYNGFRRFLCTTRNYFLININHLYKNVQI